MSDAELLEAYRSIINDKKTPGVIRRIIRNLARELELRAKMSAAMKAVVNQAIAKRKQEPASRQ